MPCLQPTRCVQPRRGARCIERRGGLWEGARRGSRVTLQVAAAGSGSALRTPRADGVVSREAAGSAAGGRVEPRREARLDDRLRLPLAVARLRARRRRRDEDEEEEEEDNNEDDSEDDSGWGVVGAARTACRAVHPVASTAAGSAPCSSSARRNPTCRRRGGGEGGGVRLRAQPAGFVRRTEREREAKRGGGARGGSRPTCPSPAAVGSEVAHEDPSASICAPRRRPCAQRISALKENKRTHTHTESARAGGGACGGCGATAGAATCPAEAMARTSGAQSASSARYLVCATLGVYDTLSGDCSTLSGGCSTFDYCCLLASAPRSAQPPRRGGGRVGAWVLVVFRGRFQKLSNAGGGWRREGATDARLGFPSAARAAGQR
jgi:hypothetical protein